MDNHAITIDSRLCRVEPAVGTGHGETLYLHPTAAHRQHTAHRIEGDDGLAAIEADVALHRTAVRQRFAIRRVPGGQRQACADIALVARMDIRRIAQVDAHHLRGMRQRQRRRLRLAQQRPRALLTVIGARAEAGQLHPDKRQRRCVPVLPPLLDQGLELIPIGQRSGIGGIALALVPDHPLDREWRQRVDHAVVQQRRDLVLVIVQGDRHLAGTETPALQLHLAAIGQAHEQFGRLTVDATTTAQVLHSHRDHVAAGLQLAGGQRIHTRCVPGHRRRADLHAIDEGAVRVIDPSDSKGAGLRSLCRAQGELGTVPADPVHAGIAAGFP